MTSESQDIEQKQSRHDDYLKWICGFANAQGGRIFIGKDDAGNFTGLKNAKKLLEDLGNQLGNTKERTLAEMKNNPKVSGAQPAERLEISKTDIESNIKQMREDGLIERIGGTRSHWAVVESDKG